MQVCCPSRRWMHTTPPVARGYNARDTEEGERRASGGTRAPQKRFFRQRPHMNPFSIHTELAEGSPVAPSAMDWSAHFPVAGRGRQADVADVGCGYGGLLVGLAPILPSSLIVGMEIRNKVTEFVRLRIAALRAQHPGKFDNISVVRANTMRYFPNYFSKGQLSKMFICFPDPHFKAGNFRRRIVTRALLDEYAFALRPGGILYTITDVPDLRVWMDTCLDQHPAFRRLDRAELEADPCVPLMFSSTEEGVKVDYKAGQKLAGAHVRVQDAEAAARETAMEFWDAPGAKAPAGKRQHPKPAPSPKGRKKATPL